MSSIRGECFVASGSYCEKNSIIFGRNSLSANEGEVQEVVYLPTEKRGTAKCDGGADIDGDPKYGVILSKGALTWGGDSGANNQQVCVGISYSDGEPTEDSVRSTDLLRLALERSATAEDAVNEIGSLYEQHGSEKLKANFVILDPKEAWILSVGGKLWAAERLRNETNAIPSSGLAVTTRVDKSIENLEDKLKDLGLWDGNGDLDFAKSFSFSPETIAWPSIEKPGDDGFGVTDMFKILRSTESKNVLSSHVSTLELSRNSCHWFTGTPNPLESVFKPFVFTSNVRISPLTTIQNDDATLLHKLHKQRKWELVGSLLKSLEKTCVEEVKGFLSENPEPNQELDDLMKDCVEAEVKFYR